MTLYQKHATNDDQISVTFVISTPGIYSPLALREMGMSQNGDESLPLCHSELNLDVSGQKPVNRTFTFDPPIL